MVWTAARQRDEYSVAQIDVFSGPAFTWAEVVCWTLRRLRKPYVLTLHGGNLPRFAARWPSRVNGLLSSAKAVTAPSGYLKEKLEPYCRGITVIPNPIDIGRYPYRERTLAQPKLAWLRAFHEIYNSVMAVKVVAALAHEFPGVELAMIGPDKGDGSFERTRTEARALGIAERVRFTGGESGGAARARLRGYFSEYLKRG
jgi:glycosyltransferase involved in cell wall biosynthesis